MNIKLFNQFHLLKSMQQEDLWSALIEYTLSEVKAVYSIAHLLTSSIHCCLVSSTILFCWFRIIVYGIKTHSTFLTPLSLQMGDPRCVEFWSNCPLCFPPVESKFTTHQYSITSDEKMVEFLRQPIFRLKNRSECKSSLFFPYISFSVSTEVIFW